MVEGYPEIVVKQTYGYGLSVPASDQIWGICVESTKGEPFVPVFVQTPNQCYQDFKVRLDGFWGVGGQGLYIVRVTSGSPAAAVHSLKDTAATPATVLTLTAKKKGSYDITINASDNASGGFNLTLEEAGLPKEQYFGVATFAEMAERLNAESNMVTAVSASEGNSHFAVVTNVVLGEGAGNTAGSDGTTKTGAATPADLGELATADAPAAHRAGLAKLEDYDIAGVFSISKLETVQDEYVVHAESMSAADVHKWRYASVGAAAADDSKAKILLRTQDYDSENVLFVGQGLVDRNNVQYAPYEATMAIAGKRSGTWYGNTIWGGDTEKRLGIKEEQFFVDILPMVSSTTTTTNADRREYNEKGVITFTKDFDGVRIREGVTSVQPGNVLEEDEEAVVSIVRKVKKVIYNAAFQMLGKNITPSYKTDLEEHIKSALEEMKNQDKTIIDLPEEQLKAYTVVATVVPRSSQRLGKVIIDASVTPVHAARSIQANVVIL